MWAFGHCVKNDSAEKHGKLNLTDEERPKLVVVAVVVSAG